MVTRTSPEISYADNWSLFALRAIERDLMRASWGHKINCCGRRLARLGVGLGLLGMGCSVDDRTLSSGAASSTGNGVLTGAAGAATEAMQGMDEMDPTPELPICDYGTDVEPGCETLVKNPGFESAIRPWARRRRWSSTSLAAGGA